MKVYQTDCDYRKPNRGDWRRGRRLVTPEQLTELKRLGYTGGPCLLDFEAEVLIRTYRAGKGARRR
jgi:hypothetical protein